ncbi:2-succinylbenzoate--CoA ligase-like [Physella acuta]|uniref:2-succinylbenzoate--CoA ligase-like n=1 Tax=Physella acuta TaxID=109671 RepID=UPI0027DC54C8|nr:2-succinylbenzoate--CoA ligase-like [Physella acuta]
MPSADTINKRLQHLAEEDPDKKSFCFINLENVVILLSRKQLHDLSRRYASRLNRYGIQKGDIICSVMANSRTRIVIDMGILMTGGVVSHGLPTFKDGEDFFTTLRNSKCSMIITSVDHPTFQMVKQYFVTKIFVTGKHTETIIPIQCDKAPTLKQAIVYELRSHEDHTSFLAGLDDEDFYEADVTAEDDAYYFFTSGSTGLSKLIPRTHREVLTISDAHPILLKDDIFFNDRTFGWLSGFPHFFMSQGLPVLVQEIFDGLKLRQLTDIWEVALNLGATCNILFAADIMTLKKLYAEGVFKKRIRATLLGGQPLKKNVLHAASLVSEVIITFYGTVDTGVIAHGTVDTKSMGKIKDCFVGNNYPYMQIRLVDETTKEVFTESNRVGLIHVKGSTVTRRYLNTTEVPDVTDDGWTNIKDAGYYDENGHLYVIGRQSDVIVSGTLNIYPQWIEERVQKCPGVETVVIVGLPHPEATQELCVCVVKERDATLTYAELKDFCQAMFLDGALNFACVPDKFVIMDGFPLLPSGKVNRKEVEKLATEHFKTKSI